MNDARSKCIQHESGWYSVTPTPDAEELQRFYAETYYQNPQSASYSTSYPDIEVRYRDLKGRVLVHALRSAGAPEGASFLDLGAGEGFLLDTAERSGFRVCGADFSSFGVSKYFPRFLDRFHVGDIFSTLETLRDGGHQFDVCSSINVLEHVTRPVQLMELLRGVVKPGGLIAITVPNDFSAMHDLLSGEGMIDREFWFAPPAHLNYFNTDSLAAFMGELGFEICDAYGDFPVDVFLMHPGSNYVREPDNGPAAHQARMKFDLMLSARGIDRYLDVYRALYRSGVGRDITVIVRDLESRTVST